MALDLLGNIPLFAVLPADERAELAALLQPREVPAGQTLFWVGDHGDDFFIVRGGTVEISAPDDNGKEVTLGVLGPGQFFGEISLLDGGARTATVRATSDSSLLRLDRENFLRFLQRHPDAAVHMLTVLGQRQRETVEKLRGIRNANDAIEARRTNLQRAIGKLASVGASEFFVLGNLVFFVAWIVVNATRYYRHQAPYDEPPTFVTLGFLITLEAILLSMFVLNSQRQQAERDRIRADLEYQVNVKAHEEVMGLHRKVDRMQVLLAQSMQAETSRDESNGHDGRGAATTTSAGLAENGAPQQV